VVATAALNSTLTSQWTGATTMSRTPVPEPRTTALRPLPSGWHIPSYKVLAGSRLAIVGVDADIVGAWRSDHKQKTLGETRRLAAKAAARVWICDSSSHRPAGLALRAPSSSPCA
jgi:hypothetical protein